MTLLKQMINELNEKKKVNEYKKNFEHGLTKTSLNKYRKISNDLNVAFFSFYDYLLDLGWHLSNDSNILYKGNSSIYLVRGSEGFEIDKNTHQSEESIKEEEKFLSKYQAIINDVFLYVKGCESFHHCNYDVRDDLTIAESDRFYEAAEYLGFTLGAEKEDEKTKKI